MIRKYFSLRWIIRFNLIFVVVIGVYGFFTDEPYWIDVGRGPDFYEYLFWLGLALNGVPGFAADYLGWLATANGSDAELRYIIQYGLWLIFLSLQWKLYDVLVAWCASRRRREIALYAVIFCTTLLGGVAAYEAWIYGHRPSELNFINQYFWFVRIGGTVLTGPVILAYSQIRNRLREP